MSPSTPRRKVLIIEDEPSIRNILYVLLAGLGYEGDVAYTGEQALTMIRQQSFDAVMLDLRCTKVTPEEVVCGIKEIRPSLVGRVLVISGEVNDPKTMEMVERECLPNVSRNLVMEELWNRLRNLLGFSQKPADSAS